MSHIGLHGPQFWLYLLALVTFLTIVLRRVQRRQIPLSDELHVKRVAIEYVHSGVAWVQEDGTIGSINASFAASLNAVPREMIGRDWYELTAWHLTAEGRCRFCGTPCPGLFEETHGRWGQRRERVTVRPLAAHPAPQ